MRLRTLALIALLMLPACHAPVTITTPQGKAAYTADQAINQIGLFQQAVIDARDAGKVKTADARTIVQWTTTAITTLHQTPSGWQASLSAGWPQIRGIVATYPAIAPYVSIVDSLLAGGQ